MSIRKEREEHIKELLRKVHELGIPIKIKSLHRAYKDGVTDIDLSLAVYRHFETLGDACKDAGVPYELPYHSSVVRKRQQRRMIERMSSYI